MIAGVVNLKGNVLKLLKQTNGFVSGQELCERLQVSRTAVWKVIRQLQEEGYKILAVRSKGYRLIEVPEIMTKAELETCMETEWAGVCVSYLPEVDSTNHKAKELAEAGCSHGTLVVADRQTAGRGRRGKFWASPPRTGVWMSLVLRPEISPRNASMLTLVAALAVREGIGRTAGIETYIKWPNDIVSNGKKLCGILTEMSAEMEMVHFVVIGIGINANMPEFPPEIAETATSILIETGQVISRNKLICAVMKAWEVYYHKFEQTQDLSLLLEEYNQILANFGREITVLHPQERYNGISLGVDALGELLVQMEDGSVRHVVSGEVSVRGIYGYTD